VTAFRNYVCWREDAVLAATPRDAASLTDWHFQAIHYPLQLLRRRLDQRSDGVWATEADVLDALKAALRPDGYLFIPVVGGSGTGKSHLIRWAKDQTADLAGWVPRYLPKNRTGLRRVIEIVIQGLAGPAIDVAREALASAPAQADADDILAERLLDELALIVGHPDQLPAESRPTDPHQLQIRQKLERQLPDLLRDPIVRRRLVAPGAVIHRLVGLALRGRQDDDGLDDDATHFLTRDLPLTFEEIGDATRPARTLLGQLATIPQLLDGAIALINAALPAAEKRVTVSSQIDLVEIFREVRRALHAESKELVLFIEDLTVLHGVEREFLDAIVEPARSPDGDMCGLRDIFAVTDGHFDGLDTVRTRCDDAFWFDAPYGESGVDRDEALSFLARYLNASRLASNEIEQAWDSRSGDTWLPNACHACPHRDTCHDTFGASREGYGLYPYNAEAASRFVQALSPSRFDPRDVVRELVNRFLLQGAADMRQSAFPAASALAAFERDTDALPPLLSARIRELRPIDHDRVVNTLRYWSEEGSISAISKAVLDAFGLDDLAPQLPEPRSLENLSVAPPSGPQPSMRPQPESPQSVDQRLRAPWRSHFAELSAWAGNRRDLSARATNDLRNLVHKIVRTNLEARSTPVHLGREFSSTRFRAERDIGIRGTVTQQNLDVAIIVIERSETVAAALQGLILANELDGDWPQADQYRRTIAACLESWTDTLAAALSAPPSRSVIATTQGLIVASAVAGRLTSTHSAADYLAAMLRPDGPEPTRLHARSPRWTGLVTQARALIPSLRSTVEAEFGESRSGAGVRAVQADRLLPIVGDFAANWDLVSEDASISSFLRAVTPAVSEEWETMRTRVIEASDHIDRDRPWSDQTEKVLSVLRTAHNAGRLRDHGAIEALSSLASAATERVQQSFFAAAEAIQKELPIDQRIVLLASDIPDDVAIVHGFTTRAVGAVESVQRDLAERQAAAGGATDIETAVAEVIAATTRFGDAVKELMA
jgi:hypothetical protein